MKAITELNEIQVSYSNTSDKNAVKTSEQANDACKQAYALLNAQISLKEHFIVLFLNRASRVIGFYHLSSGGIAGTVADLRLAFSIGLKCLASSMILCHNHPSGNTKPSQADIDLTRKFSQAGEIMEIMVVDHIVLAEDGYYSFADDGLL